MVVAALLLTALSSLAATDPRAKTETDYLDLFSPALRQAKERRAELRRQLAAFQEPAFGTTAAEFGYQHRRVRTPPLVSPWAQVDLGAREQIDWVCLVPAQIDWQTSERHSYGFPKRFRIDASDDAEFRVFTTLVDFSDADFPEPGFFPVALRAGGITGRHVRVTVTKLALENGQYFFALAEFMVVSGNRNLAAGRPVSVSGRHELPPRWSQENLVDGRTPLGPPIRKHLLAYDGYYAGPPPSGGDEWMLVDLGHAHPIDEARLYPIHSRIGADEPGYRFPRYFRVEVSADESFSERTVVYQTEDAGLSNPGNNPVTLPFPPVNARYLRVLQTGPPIGPRGRFGLSEIQVYSQGVNVAPGSVVTASPDSGLLSKEWPPSLLVDGFTSFGKLQEWPEWLAHWEQKRALQLELELLEENLSALHDTAKARAQVGLVGIFGLTAAGVTWMPIRARRRRQRELAQFRLRLARDLHDEIGSNLAGIAVLGELGSESPESTGKEDWKEVRAIASETIESMREVLWLLGAREEADADWMGRLERAAHRILIRQQIHWRDRPAELPARCSSEVRRQVFLCFKETLANIARHSKATRVELSVRIEDDTVVLEVADNGRGFDRAAIKEGIGLKSLRERMRLLHGRLVVDSAIGQGTRVELRAPL